jgi:hypothetical protein
MRGKIIFGALILAILAVAGAGTIFYLSMTQLFNDPIAHQVLGRDRDWGDWIPLSEKPFLPAAPRLDVEMALNSSRFSRVLSSDSQPRTRPEEGGTLYARNGWYTPCRIRIFVSVIYDTTDHLLRAQGMQQEEGCL